MAACPNCGEENPGKARFCWSCGAPLPEAAPVQEVRKTVTVVFTDVTGSTAMGERLDPESLRRVMTRYFDEMQTVVERHGGTVEKFIGDAVMAVFGVPTLHEDDAMRAVRAAWDMGGALATLNEHLRAEWDVEIVMRTGVNTGEVVAGDASAGQRLVTGDAVNVAARLEQAAPPGHVLLGEHTFRLVRDAVEVEPVQALALKGKVDPVPAYRLVAVEPGAAGVARHLDSPMVGRDAELATLLQALERAERERSCHLFTLLGSAGVGKSRLVEEFVRRVADRATVLRGRCLDYGEGITYYPVNEVMADAAGLLLATTPEEARAKVASLVSEDEDEDEAGLVAHRIAEMAGMGGTGAPPEEVFWAVRKVFEALARRRTLVVVFDDIHWAEPTFLDLVEHLADWTRDAPMLLLCPARPELLDVRPNWGGGKLNATSVLLEPLTAEESGRLVENLLGQAELDAAAGLRITQAAEGNPLFVEEMLSMLIDDGLLVHRNGRWAATGDLSALAVPPTIQALLSARLDRLGTEERSVLQRASVVGKVFWSGAVADLSPEAVRAGVTANLMALIRKELIRQDRSSFRGQDAFRFRPLLIRDAASQAMPKETRAELHERFALWLERAAADRLAEYEEILAYHLEQAHRYRAELGPLDDRGRALRSRAAVALAAGGKRALARSDMPAATNLLRRAQVLLSQGDPRRLDVLVSLGQASLMAGELGEAAASFDAVLREAGGNDRSSFQARLWRISLGMSSDRGFRVDVARVEVEAIIEVFERNRDDEGLALAWSVLANLYNMECRGEEVVTAGRRSAQYAARAGDPRLEAEALGMISLGLALGPMPAVAAGQECLANVERARRVGVREAEVLSHGAASIMLGLQGRFEDAFVHAQRAVDLCSEVGLRILQGAMMTWVGKIHELAGDLAGAREHSAAGIRILQDAGESGFLSTFSAELGRVLYLLDELDEADRMAELSRSLTAPNDLASQIGWRGVRARLLARAGEHAEALAMAERAVELGRDSDYLTFRGEAFEALADVHRLAGRKVEAGNALRSALELFERKGDVVTARRLRQDEA